MTDCDHRHSSQNGRNLLHREPRNPRITQKKIPLTGILIFNKMRMLENLNGKGICQCELKLGFGIPTGPGSTVQTPRAMI